MQWQRKNGEVIKIDDYDLFQNGSWIPNSVRIYLSRWLPNLVQEFDDQIKEQVKNQPDYDKLLKTGNSPTEGCIRYFKQL